MGIAAPQVPAPTVSVESASTRATELFDKGTSYLKQGRFADAELSFQAAWDIKRGYDIAANLGDCELKIGQTREAAEHLAFALREFPVTGKEPVRRLILERFKEARAAVGAVRISVSVDGAEVFVDGVSVGRSPLPDEVFVDPGARVIEAKLAAHEPARESIEVAKGSSREVSLKLAPARVIGQGGAGGQSSASGGGGGQDTGGRKSTALLVTGGVVTAAALIAGIGLTAGANGESSDATIQREALRSRGAPLCPSSSAAFGPQTDPDCVTLRGLLEDQSVLTNAAISMFVIGGATAAATLTYALWPMPKSTRPVEVRPAPVVTQTSAELWLMGTF